ncbi:MAG: chemotaxis protein CheB, partial [Ginsengibacter sp.]
MSKSDKDKPKILSDNLFPVVGIGASAGGLDAFKKLLKAIPETSGMAYILVQHLHPQHESALPEILQSVTKVPVEQISDNVKVKPDHIYVIPANKMLVATDGVLQLSARSAVSRQNLPIDIFFTSLAEVHQAQAIGVVLSGNGADGTEGLKAIKARGGLTFAQDAASAANDSMPRHAIDAGVVDFILTAEKMPEKLMELKQSFAGSSPDEHSLKDKANENAFKEIIALLRLHVGADFTFYKQTTIRRRIVRRMEILKLENVLSYLDHLKKNEPEQDVLFHDLLIPVTSFFRDPLTFGTLCEKIFPQVFKNKVAENSLRIWIAGCSTGQEAYSIAMCICEYLSHHTSTVKVQIFATDISDKSIKAARTGSYTKKELEGVSEERLNKFFDETDDGYQVKKFLREMCVFAVHNFLKDPPYAKLDLVSCRNVLIYLEPFLQQKTLGIFHYSLNEKGILLLGKSETAGSASDLFIPVEKKEKFYTRIPSIGKIILLNGEPKRSSNGKDYLLQKKEPATVDFQKSADDILLSTYAPAGVIVNEQFDVVQFRGSTSEYLEPAQGKASFNVLKMAKEGLAFELRNALHRAQSTGKTFIKENISINKARPPARLSHSGGDDPVGRGAKLVTIEVTPLLNTVDLYFLILFKDLVPEYDPRKSRRKGVPSIIKLDLKNIRIEQLEKELAGTRDDMYSITEDQESANEELQSSNEELLSNTEELQSLNEELETTKEELQSSNEALMTLNEELNASNEELNKSRMFAETTLATLHEPMLLLDNKFCIKSANKSFYKTFKLTKGETLGKIIFELQDNGWNIPGLKKELVKIRTEKEKMIETEIAFPFPVIGKRSICINIQPVSNESGEQLIILAFDDVTSRRNEERLLKEKAGGVLKERQLLHNLFNQAPAMIAILKGKDYVF